MENGRVGLSSSQVNWVVGKKLVILSGLKTGSSQSGCGSGRVDLYFLHDFFFLIKKTICIYHLKIYATNHLM